MSLLLTSMTRTVPPAPLQPATAAREHPRRSASMSEIVRHIVADHHRTLGEQLLELADWFDRAEPNLDAERDGIRQLRGLFEEFKDELVRCLNHEKGVVFPLAEKWDDDCRQFSWAPPPDALVRSAAELARWHSKLLVQSWKLARRVGDLEPRSVDARVLDELRSALSRCCENFYQQLFEVDCLLLPRIAREQPHHPSPERELCPRY